MNQFWSYLLTVVGVTGFILAGKKIWWAWYINIFCQFLWFTYAIVTHQWGFILGSLVYTAVFINNAYKWTIEHRMKQVWDLNEYAYNIETFERPMQDYAEKDVELTQQMYRHFNPMEPIWRIFVYNPTFGKEAVDFSGRNQTQEEAEEQAISWLNAWPKDIVMLVKEEEWTR